MSFVWLHGMTRAHQQIWHLSAHRKTATTWRVHGRTYALQASKSHYGRVGAHAAQQHEEEQRPPRLTRLCLLFLPLLLQFDPQEVLLLRFLFEFVFHRPWRPHTGSVVSVHCQHHMQLSYLAHFCAAKKPLKKKWHFLQHQFLVQLWFAAVFI